MWWVFDSLMCISKVFIFSSVQALWKGPKHTRGTFWICRLCHRKPFIYALNVFQVFRNILPIVKWLTTWRTWVGKILINWRRSLGWTNPPNDITCKCLEYCFGSDDKLDSKSWYYLCGLFALGIKLCINIKRKERRKIQAVRYWYLWL